MQSFDQGIQTRQNVVAPNNRFGQQRGFNFQGGASDPALTPAEQQAQAFGTEIQTRRDGQPDQFGVTQQGERGELGVWLMASGGQGVEIRRVTQGSAAAEIGLRSGDMLLTINGQTVMTPMEVQRLIRAIPPGQTVTLGVWRDGTQQDVSVALQPMRESYQSGYRGAEMASGDLESRTMRLEEQLDMVMQELRQLRTQLQQRQQGAIGQSTEAELGSEQDSLQQETTSFEENSVQPEPAAVEPQPSATSTEQQPAEESAEPAEDVFGNEPAETDATPTDEPEADSETETDGDLFQ
jgi:hypothetical protein